ncbi:VC0807 family protein [Desulfosporosinus sp. FKA]|uniref:VC0807 family protein n=1 Tax=Desulfosporosinus sp. FKA TaxID=1969834 RepID=UPI000B49F7EB|nr:VC0807 family protein [Desulfosporosinus sp. FKA]
MNTIKSKEVQSNQAVTQKLLSENFFNLEFFLSVVIPIILFSAFDHFDRTLTGTITAGVWSLGVLLLQFCFRRNVNIYGAIGAGCAAIGLIGTVLSKDPIYYLVSPIIIDLILAAVFLGSVILGKPLIRILAEYSLKQGFSEEIRKQPKFKSAWIILTIAWGVLSITQALLRVVLLYTVSKNVYYAISTAYGNISTPLLLIISFWFPGWYWKRSNT